MSRLRRRLARGLGPRPAAPPAQPEEPSYDSWLEDLYDHVLGPIDAACREGGPERLALFRELDDDLWTLLLTREYEVYPHIRSLLPRMPDRGFQELWNGPSGLPLAAQGQAFYSKLRDRYGAHGARSLAESSVLDFGCGWGRLTRFLARDVQPGRLYGCDPVQLVLDQCEADGVPAKLARSDFMVERLPFEERFDLVFAFSVFTHLSEPAHQACLRGIHAAMDPGGLLIVTVRPPEYLGVSPLMHDLLEGLGPDHRRRLREPAYLFAPHPAEATHLQYEGGEMTYGETVVTLAYVRERWEPMFELLEVDVLVEDLHQVMLTLRRR